MDTSIFIALLNPCISAVLGATFLILWSSASGRSYMAWLGAGYFATACGFLLQHFVLPIGFYPTKLVSTLFFLSAGVLIAGAISMRYGRRIPYVALSAVCGSGVAAFLWFLYGAPSLTWRILTINFALGGVCLVVAWELRAVSAKTIIEKALLAASLFTAVNFALRTLVIVALQGGYDSYEGLYTSLYWTTTLFTHALLSLTVAICLLVAAASDLVRDLKAESNTDPLSRLLNRRGFEEQAGAMLARCAGAGLPAALVIADLDHFKSVNDRYGHAAGDRVIADFAARLASAAGLRGVAGRLGGEEFAVLLPLSDMAAARLFAEAVRTIFSGGGIDGLPQGARVTASFGVAARKGDEGLHPLLARADAALYRAKHEGRDRVRVGDEGGEAVPTGASNSYAGRSFR